MNRLFTLTACCATVFIGPPNPAGPCPLDLPEPVATAQPPQVGPSPSGGATGGFVVNVGQWDHRARFVRRSGPMTLLLESRGWTLDLVRPGPAAEAESVASTRPAVAVRMEFVGAREAPQVIGEARLPGHHDYFVGDRSRWRTGVPRFASVRYRALYPGIDVRMRERSGAPEYDLLLEPGADLGRASVRVQGAERLEIAPDGSLVTTTVLGTIVQPRPATWQTDRAGRRQEVPCAFVLLGPDQFGFSAPSWRRDTALTIDPGLLWSTLLGGSTSDNWTTHTADDLGIVTVTGLTDSIDFPVTPGAYAASTGNVDVFVSRLDPHRTGTAQLVSSTYLGGRAFDQGHAVHVGPAGVITVAGTTASADFPTTAGAYDPTYNGTTGFGGDCFVARLDPSRTGTAQLVYSTFVGGRAVDVLWGMHVSGSGRVTIVGQTDSNDFPLTVGGRAGAVDAFVCQIEPGLTGAAQLAFSTLVGGRGDDVASAVVTDPAGRISVAGWTRSVDFPTTPGAYDTGHNGANDVFVTRLDVVRPSPLVYSTFLGGAGDDHPGDIAIDSSGVVTVAGSTVSAAFPTTGNAWSRGSGTLGTYSDAFVSLLDPSLSGSAQLVYSTAFGGTYSERDVKVTTTGDRFVTIAGLTMSSDLPTTANAYDRTRNGAQWVSDAFVARLDLSRTGAAQLVYSSYLGGSGAEAVSGLTVDRSGAAIVTGHTQSGDFPTTAGAYSRTFAGVEDAYVSRIDMGVALHADVHEIPVFSGGTQRLTLNAGTAHAGRVYWVLGSMSGTAPGVTVGTVHVPINLDAWTTTTVSLANSSLLTGTLGRLDAGGGAQASFRLPALRLPALVGIVLHHAYVVVDANRTVVMASNAVPVRLVP